MKLYEIVDRYTALLDTLESGAEGLEDTLQALEDSLEVKLENCVKVWRSLIADRDLCKQEAYRLTERANSFDKKAATLHSYIEVMMRRAGLERVNTSLFTLAIQNNPESVEITQADMIPPQFWRQPEPEVDKVAIKAALKGNVPVPGAELKQTQRLQIR